MDFMTSFDISASGMSVEKLRMDLISLNLANSKTSRTEGGGVYKPLALVTKSASLSFSKHLNQTYQAGVSKGVMVDEVIEKETPEKLSYEPGHPDADGRGFVHYPGVDTTSEMVEMLRATRAYEANVRALNAAKSMALKALEIGGQ